MRHYVGCLFGIALSATASARAQPGPQPQADASRYAERRERAYARLGADILVVQSQWTPARATQAGFDQDATFLYFTGAERALGAVLVLDGASHRAEVFVPAPVGGHLAPLFTRNQPRPGAAAAATLHVDAVSPWSDLATYIDRRLADAPRLVIHVDGGGVEADIAGTLATPFDSDATPANQHVAWRRAVRRQWPNATLVTDTVAVSLRAVKDSAEIAVLRRVGRTTADAFLAGLSRFAPGRRQRHVEAAVVEHCTRTGDGPSFWPWAMTGPNAAFPTPFSSLVDPHTLDRVMQAGEIARFDIGCKVDHYMGDVGRTVPVSGKFTPGQAEVVDLLAAVYRAGLATLHDGAGGDDMLAASMAEAARRRPAMRTSLGRHAAALMASRDSIPFWQSHGIGLDYAEALPAVLRSGMVLDYEPIFVVDGQGFYMEDMILITRTGFEILTPGLPNTAAEIEQAMARLRR